MRVLVAYGTKYGATAEIAEAIASTLRQAGVEVDCKRAGSLGSLEPYGAVVLGSAVYMGRWRSDAARLLRRRRRELAERDVWLFSSGPTGEQAADEGGRWVKPKRVERLAPQVGAHEHVVFGGRVSEDRGFMRKNMAKNLAPELRDRRDWDAIRSWAKRIATTLGADGSQS